MGGRNKFFLSLAPISAVLLIWILISVKQFSFNYITNEVDSLPSARQFVERTWLPNDWYLNLDIDYRQPFNLAMGALVSWLGFEYGAYAGRILVYLLLAVSIYTLFRAFRLRISFGLLFFLFFLNHQSLIAGEWIVGGADTKTLAYAFNILSCAAFFRKRYLVGFAFAGAAVSFHVLVGLYALICMVFAILLLNGTWRSEWRTYIDHSWPFFITGIFGLKAIAKQLLPQSGVDIARAWEIYVQYRVPHHVLPEAWTGWFWIAELVMATCVFVTMHFISQSRATRFAAAYALGSISLFLFGLALYAFGEINLLRYYWFRFPDVIVPFMIAVSIALVLNDFVDGRLSIPSLPHSLQHRMQLILSRGVPILLTLATLLIVLQSMDRLRTEIRDSRPVLEWIAENTPKQAIFLVDPSIADFYIYAQRAMFVSFRHFPQSAADIVEWYERIKLCNNNYLPSKSGFRSIKEIQTNFYSLGEDLIRQIADSYGVRYYLGLSQKGLTFECAYSDARFTVYKVNHTQRPDGS